MSRSRNPVLLWLLAQISIFYANFTARIPILAARRLGHILGSIAYYVIPRIRKVGMSNLDLAYGDSLSYEKKKQILKQATQNVGIVASEFSHIPRLRKEYLSKYIQIEGSELIDRDRGAIVIGAHLGNWEWCASAIISKGHLLAGVVRPLDDPRLNKYIDGIRRSGDAHSISKHNAGPEIMRLLKDGWIIGILIDQSPRENGVPVKFFDQPCWGTIAPVMIAMRKKVPVHPISMVREANGHYTFRIGPALNISKSGNFLHDLSENTQRCQDAIESIVRENPEQWLWLHRRWKQRPNLEKEWVARVARDKKRQ